MAKENPTLLLNALQLPFYCTMNCLMMWTLFFSCGAGIFDTWKLHNTLHPVNDYDKIIFRCNLVFM